MANKRFSPSLSKKHDGKGKKNASEIMRDLFRATLLTDNVKETAGDFSDGFWDQKYSLPDGSTLLVEPEMKDQKWWGSGWSEDRPFKFDSMDIPFRKKKNKADLFMVISTGENYAWVIWRDVMQEHFDKSGGQPKTKRTIYEPDGGDYFSTPVSKGLFVQKINNKWVRWIK